MTVMIRWLLTWLAVLSLADASAADYTQIEPILRERCVLCHAGAAAPLGLRLDTLEGVLAGSSRGPVVKTGDVAGSELIRRLRGNSLPRMPMTGPPYLDETQVGLFEAWVVGGLQPGTAPVAATTPAAPAVTAVPASNAPPSYLAVAPIFATRCAKCHAVGGLMGDPPEGFVLTSHAQTLDATDRARVVPGQPDASELVRRIRGQARPRMPLDGPPYLSDDEIALIVRWIEAGAPDSAGQAAPLPVGARVRLHGTLDDRGSLDGWAFASDGDTRFDKRPRPGNYVELRGRVMADGSVSAQRLRRR
jgi:mono/diheme cytochrome c family protein